MSSYDVLKTTQLYQTDPDVRRRVDLRIAKDRVFEDKRLFNLDIEITTDCNLKCRTCYNPYLKHSSLSLKQFEEIIQKGKNLANFLNLDGLWITISGGEPFLHPDIIAMLRIAKAMDVIGIAIITNGTLLSEKIIDKIHVLKINEIMVSIDGSDCNTHDQIRGIGSFEKMLKGVSYLHNRSPNTFTGSTLTLTPKNYNQIEDYIRLSFDLGFCYAWINPPLQTGRLIDNNLAITREQSEYASTIVRNIDNAILKYGFNIYYNLPYYALSDPVSPFADFQTACPFARNNLTVCSNGNILPCLYSRDYILGNIFEHDLLSIYNIPELLEYRKGNNLAPECRSCQLAAFCGGCRARTYYRTGDWFAKDTWCPLINKN